MTLGERKIGGQRERHSVWLVLWSKNFWKVSRQEVFYGVFYIGADGSCCEWEWTFV